jgi:alpha-D-ribose 1-methylphosphonate 5-phosphate C-P lyase
MSNPREYPAAPGRRQHDEDHLILSELNPQAVVDSLDADGVPFNLVTFGNVREVCPKCRQHLKLVLRQTRVRIAHLLCSGCESCFDAHYANGTPALTI